MSVFVRCLFAACYSIVRKRIGATLQSEMQLEISSLGKSKFLVGKSKFRVHNVVYMNRPAHALIQLVIHSTGHHGGNR